MGIGGLIRDRRKALGWSQTELAERMGWAQTYLSRVERGEVDVPQRATLEKLGGLLGLRLEEFYRAAGMLDGIEVVAGEPPAPPPEERDRAFDPAAIVAYVEAKPDPKHRAQLARQKARRTPESYTRLCLRLYRAWTSNADLLMGELEAVNH
jgi:transcriptional regulator with XRE-family HTH domain